MILIVDDDKVIRGSLSVLLRKAGYEAEAVGSPEEAVDAVRSHLPRLIIMDMNFGQRVDGRDGIELLRRVKILAPAVPVILITAWGSIPLAVEGMKYGAFDFITKPYNPQMFLRSVATALELTGGAEDAGISEPEFDRSFIIGRSKLLEDVLQTVRRIAPTDASVLITGENGTGKELIAQAIHRNSRRRNAQLVMVNLGGIPQSLFESEMFGHAKGAFTGAVSKRIGRFEMADKGTIFLDEIGELDLNCQVKLQRVLQQQTFEPLGESRPVRVDTRVVAATNADLGAMLADRTFREDLYYRISTITVHLPALRERREDIPLLVRHFAALHSPADTPEFSSAALETLSKMPWRGNIRQLKNVVERCILISGKKLIDSADIPADDIEVQARQGATPPVAPTLEEMERSAVLAAIEKHGGNLSNAALELGITRQSLYRRMEKFGLKL